jgi:hypothetical protein
MPVINGSVTDFAGGKDASSIIPLPWDPTVSPGPEQRGPTCGFYALGFVMQYWYEKQTQNGGNPALTAPLPVRTNTAPPAERAGFFGKTVKSASALVGSYSSLRHYGKYNKLTAYGSVFNAESLVKVAKGQGAQYQGQYNGHVVTTTNPDDLVTKAKRFLDRECPLIIPFDVGDDGDPMMGASGERAHWAVIAGWYSEGGEDYFIHYHWGKYRYAKAQAFGGSNHNLTSNKVVMFQKVEIKRKDGSVYSRDYKGPSFSSQVPSLQSQGAVVVNLDGPKRNLEMNNPGGLQLTSKQAGEASEHGFDPGNLVNAGLIKKLVAVYPQSLQASLSTL